MSPTPLHSRSLYCFTFPLSLILIEERLRLLESVVVNVNDGIVITEAEPINFNDSRILYIDEAFSCITGYS